MPDFRSFCQPTEREPGEILLSPEESHHLVTVNRARAGDTIVAFDGRGAEWICELADPDRKAARLTVRFLQNAKPLPYKITLGQALPKGKYMDSIVRKATEIGIFRIAPLQSDRTQVQVSADRQDQKLEKWSAAALEAAKQCGNPWLPEILPVQSASSFMQEANGYDLKLIASLQPGARPLRQVFQHYHDEKGHAPRNPVWLIGPEGDFTPAELSLSKATGFEPVSLGPLVLRCETAAVYALSILSYELQNL